MKRIISIIISISLLLMSVPVFAISGTGTESNPYLISSASDIAKIHDDLDGYYKLTSNINMSGVDFEPIGNENEGAFTGTIDGNGYTISNLNTNLPENKYVGFVGYLEGTVKNLNLTNVDAFGYRYVGGLIGFTENGSYVDNCSVLGEINGQKVSSLKLYLGGITGYNCGTINNSKNYAEVIVRYDYVGGIAGYNIGTILRCANKGTLNSSLLDYSGNYASGTICGYNASNATVDDCRSKLSSQKNGMVGYNSGNILNCINNSTIDSGDYSVAAGIATYNHGKIKASHNNGNISCSHSDGIIAGIAAYNTGIIENCLNTGSISGKMTEEFALDYMGGIAANNSYGKILNSANSGYISSWASTYVGAISGYGGTISDCFNNGIIECYNWIMGIGYSNITNSINVGGLINSAPKYSSYSSYPIGYSNVTNSYACQEIYYTERSYNVNWLSEDGMKNKDSFNGFDFDSIWTVDEEVGSGLPQLQNLPTHIDLSECIQIFEVGDSNKIYAYIDGVNENVSWHSSDNSIAVVSSEGLVTAKSNGSCMITATNSEGIKANCHIYVYEKAEFINLSAREVDMNKGESYLLKCTQNPSTANETVLWCSEDSNIASINQNGAITANAKGTTVVYAITTQTERRAECIINVYAPISSISLSATNKTIKVGDSNVITATIYPTSYDGSVTWSSSDEEIVSVDQNGKITANKVGVADIKATSSGGVSAQCKVTVVQPATSIKLNKANATTYVGSTYQLSATVLPADTTDDITWSSSSTSYATVSSTGLVTGNRAGTTTITAKTSSGLTATCYVTVKAAQVMPTSVTLSDTYITLAPEDAKALIPTLEPSNTTETTLTWTSSDGSVATVDKNGVVTAVSNGFATIRGKTTNGLTSECVVKVVSATGTSVLLDNTKASPGGTAQVKANIVKNPGVSAYKFKVNYDASVLTPVSIIPNTEFGGTFSTNLEDADRTELNVLWYSGNEDVATNGELFTVNFKVNDSAAYGDSSIVSIEYGANDICDVSGNYIAIYTEDATVSVTNPRPGDIHEDSDVNVYDLTLLARYITSLETFTERQEEAADVNDDGRVDILDVIRLAQYLVKWSGIELMSLDLYDEPTTPVISVGSASVNELNEAEIPVYIKNNSGILGYRFVFDYNAEDIEILSITPSELINKDGFNHNLGAESQATDGLVVSCYASGNDITDDGVLFTIKVRYKNPADTSVSPISVVDSFDNMGNENATYVTATYETGYALGSDYIVANKVVGDTNFSCELYFDDSYAEQSAKAIIAFYDSDGRMVQLMPKDITVKPGKVDLSIDYDKKAYATYKLMIWEGMNSLKPITEVK